MSDEANNLLVSVVGLGYVGLPLVLLTERKGYSVVGIDIDTDKVSKLQNRIMPFVDSEVGEQLKESQAQFTTDSSAIATSDIVIICVPTPVYENHMPNLEPVIGATEMVAKHLKKGQLVILESTVNPGVSETVVLPILEKTGLKCGEDFYLAHCPERINPGDPKWNVSNINRVVGSYDAVGLDKAAKFYESIISGTIKRMGSLKEAEACKVVENSFRDINIAFVNELARSFDKLGIDVVNVIDGAATKPFAFMAHYPSCGVGGHCIPVDPYYLIEYAKEQGFHHDFLSLARRINNDMPHYTVKKLQDALNEKKLALKGSNITVLGLAYKADIGDVRESPAYEVIKDLKEHGANVCVYDPYVPEESSVATLDDALSGAHALVIATNHKEFKELTTEKLVEKGIKVVIDGKNCIKEKMDSKDLLYTGIGR